MTDRTLTRDEQVKHLMAIYGVSTERDVVRRALEIAYKASKYAQGSGSGGGGEDLMPPTQADGECHTEEKSE